MSSHCISALNMTLSYPKSTHRRARPVLSAKTTPRQCRFLGTPAAPFESQPAPPEVLMLYLLLTLPVLVIGLGLWVRFGPSSSADVALCVRRRAARPAGRRPPRPQRCAGAIWAPPRQRTASRVAARALASQSGELLAADPAPPTRIEPADVRCRRRGGRRADRRRHTRPPPGPGHGKPPPAPFRPASPGRRRELVPGDPAGTSRQPVSVRRAGTRAGSSPASGH